MGNRCTARREQGAGAVYSPSVAAELLPFRDATALRWLRRRGLVHEDPELGQYVVWREVLDRLQYGGPDPDPPRPVGALPRAGLSRG